MKAWHVVLVVLAVGLYFLMRPPSAGKIAGGIEVDLQSNSIRYDGRTYTATWGEPGSRAGDVRYLIRDHDKRIPIVLYHLVLTTGEFSDPEIVTIDHNRGGNFIWRAKKQPEGTIIVLHLVPENELAFRTMRGVKEGDRIEVFGRDEVRGSIERDDGAYLRLGHDNHKFVLVTRVERR